MKARIYHPCKHGLYWGQLYNEKRKCWDSVTLSCFTRGGAKRALKRYVKKELEFEEFEI